MPELSSEKWLAQFEIIARKIYDLSDKKYVSFDENSIKLIKKEYPIRVHSIKRDVFGDDDPTGKKIDHHKIVALYIQLFLEKSVFVLQNINSKPHPSSATLLINEIFCLRIMCVIIEEWCNKKFDNDKFKEYRKWFFRLLDNYKEHQEFHRRNALFTCSFAHLIYFIERVFFIPSKTTTY